MNVSSVVRDMYRFLDDGMCPLDTMRDLRGLFIEGVLTYLLFPLNQIQYTGRPTTKTARPGQD